MPATGLTHLDQWMPDEPAIGQQRAVGAAQVRDDAVEQRADDIPLALLPGLVHGQHLPTHRQQARMHQHAEIEHGRALVQRRRVEHEDQASITPEPQELPEQLGPHRDHRELLVGQQARETAFAARRLGGADADEGLCYLGQARGASQHDAQDEEGQRFAAVSMHFRQAGPQLARPLAPEPYRCVHRRERSFPIAWFVRSMHGTGSAFSWLYPPSTRSVKKCQGERPKWVVAVEVPRRVVLGPLTSAGPANASAALRPVVDLARQAGVIGLVVADAEVDGERKPRHIHDHVGADRSIPAKRGKPTWQLHGIRAELRANFPTARYRQRALVESVFSAAKRTRSSRAPGRLPVTQHLQVLLLGLAYDLYRIRHAPSLPPSLKDVNRAKPPVGGGIVATRGGIAHRAHEHVQVEGFDHHPHVQGGRQWRQRPRRREGRRRQQNERTTAGIDRGACSKRQPAGNWAWTLTINVCIHVWVRR